jgi:hypothetical protein
MPSISKADIIFHDLLQAGHQKQQKSIYFNDKGLTHTSHYRRSLKNPIFLLVPSVLLEFRCHR